MSAAETPSGPARGRLRAAAAVVGLGMVAGAVVLVVVAWLFGDPPVDGSSRGWSYWEVADGDVWSPVTTATVVAVFVPVCAVVLAVVYWRSWRQKRAGALAVSLSGGGCLLRGLLVLGAGVVVVLSLRVLVPLFDWQDQVAADVGSQLILATVALVAVVAGAVLVWMGVDWSLPTLRAIPAAVAAIAGVVLVGVPGVVLGVEYSDTAHTDATTAARIAAPPPPAAPARQAWRWRTDQMVLDVQAAGTGFVVLTTSGVIAVDGATGTERWHYLRDDLSVDYFGRLRILDGGRTVVLPLGGPGRFHAFDGFTGELLWQTDELDERLSTEVPDARTELVSVEEHLDTGTTAVARDSRTGAIRWRRLLGHSLADDWDAAPPRTPSDVLIIRCESEKDIPFVVALDGTDGRELWRSELGTGEAQGAGPAGPEVVAVPDDTGRAPVVRLFDQRSGRLLGSFPGRAIASDGTAFDGTSFVEPGRGVRWTYDGARGDLAVERDVRTEAVLPTAIAALTYRPGGTDDDRQLLIFDRETGALRQEFPVSTYQVSQVGAEDGPWVVAGPGAVVTVTDLSSNASGAELVGYR